MFEEVKAKLGVPYYEEENVLIYNGDSMRLLPLLGDETINSVITSPPYNIGKQYASYCDRLPVDEYLNWSREWLSFIPKVLKKDGSFLLNLGYFEVPGKGRNVPIPYLLWDKIDMYLLQEIVWNYGAGVACKKMLSPRNEKWLWYVMDPTRYTFNLDAIRDPDVKYPNQKKNGKLRCNTLGKNPSDVWQIAKVTSGANRSSVERENHPAQFPTDLVDRIILGMTNEQDIILDPFLGSGSTAISALSHGRKCIGFEISEEYCDIAKRRIGNYPSNQRSLLSDRNEI